jgi:hypothetical protein
VNCQSRSKLAWLTSAIPTSPLRIGKIPGTGLNDANDHKADRRESNNPGSRVDYPWIAAVAIALIVVMIIAVRRIMRAIPSGFSLTPVSEQCLAQQERDPRVGGT